MKSRSSVRIIATAASSRISEPAPRTSSYGVFSCMSYPTASIAFVSYGLLAEGDRGQKLAYVRDLLHVASKPQEQVDPEKARAATQKPTPFATPSCAAQIAGASCAALKPSRPGPRRLSLRRVMSR